MKPLITIVLFLIMNLSIKAQDGSDILYVEESKIKKDLLGKFIHIDFYTDSFGNQKFKSRTADTVGLDFNGERRFVEIRNDDGYNNWFSEQYLESVKLVRGKRLRIQKMKLLDISKDSIRVKLFGHYFKKDKEVFDRYLTETISISRDKIYKILINTNPEIREGLSIYHVYHSYPSFTSKDRPDCNYCFEPTEENISNDPLLLDYHIEKYNHENKQIILTDAGRRIINKLEIPLQGLPVVLTLDGEIIYGLWFWNEISSFGCDRVYTYPKLNFEIKFGLPVHNTFGKDPRFDRRLEAYDKVNN